MFAIDDLGASVGSTGGARRFLAPGVLGSHQDTPKSEKSESKEPSGVTESPPPPELGVGAPVPDPPLISGRLEAKP